MECDCIPQTINGIVYGLGLALIVWTVLKLTIDSIQGR